MVNERLIEKWRADAKKFNQIWSTLQAFRDAFWGDYCDDSDRRDDIEKQSGRIAIFVEVIECENAGGHEWGDWYTPPNAPFANARKCKKCVRYERRREQPEEQDHD